MSDAEVTVPFAARLDEGVILPTEDLLHAVLPLMRQVAALHALDRVADLAPEAIVEDAEGRLALLRPDGRPATYNDEALRRAQPQTSSALRVVGEYRVATVADTGSRVDDLRVRPPGADDPVTPAYLVGYRAWEQDLGCHDDTADILVMGLILASLACGLDLRDLGDVRRFAAEQSNLFRLSGDLHPVIGGLISEMTRLNRHERASDMAALADRLERYRDQPAVIDVERALAGASGVQGRREAVLSHLRDRLFDLSRRNRLIHFRPTQASVNLTAASVPMVLRLEAIRPEQLCVWDDRFAQAVLGGGPVALTQWLRFEDQPYLPPAFDRIIQETRRDRAEYGFSSLRLVVAFLHWHNLKEAPNERIASPLLWLPVEISRKKGVRDQYVLQCPSSEAEFNPALRHHLRQLYGMELPDSVDLDDTAIEAIHADIAAQIHASEPGVSLSLTTRPQIELVHQKAVQRLRAFQRRKGHKVRAAGLARPDFSYDADDYRPLGLALFEKHVRPSPLPQRIAVGAPLPPRAERMAPADDAEGLSYALRKGEGHPYAWDIDLTQVTVANFNYKKMSLVRDYNRLIDDAIEAPAFDHIFSIEPRPFEEGPPPVLATAELNGVVAADATQDAAVALARTGRSFIIQGPPGTGKSQTITNLIADFVARGKRVLFVCEKRAALDVVFNRLKASGLDRLACLIHDSQEDKKAFVLDLKDSYERWSAAEDCLDARAAERGRIIEALERHLHRIAEFDAAAAKIPEATGASVRAIARRRAALIDPPPLGAAEREALPALTEWDRNRGLADRIHRAMSEAFGLDSLAEHPFGRLAPQVAASDRAYAEAEAAIEEAESLMDALDATLDEDGLLADGAITLLDAARLTAAAQAAMDSNLASHFDLLEPASEAAARFTADRLALQRLNEAARAAAEAAIGWRDPLTPQDARAALDQARRQEPSFFKFLSGAWGRLKRTVRARYDFSGHAVAPTIVAVLERLVAAQEANAAETDARRAAAARWGTSDVDVLAQVRDVWATTTLAALRTLAAHARASGDSRTVLARQARSAQAVADLKGLCDRFLIGADALPLGDLAEALRDMREGLDDLPDLLPLLAAADAADPRVAHVLRCLPLSPHRMEAAVLDEAFARILRQEPALQRFDAAALGAASARAARARALLHTANAEAILAACHRRFRDNVRRSTLSVTGLDAEGREFKKLYSTGRRELEHEFGKSRAYRSIRDLADEETGVVVGDLKPVWLMSPLSVSDTLPLHPALFDVVIFDEASQIPMEEAAPALSRAPQVVVVGDEMQLPPTSFFSAALADDEMQVTAEEDGETVAILLDADSLLNQSARTLPATLLAWHYRSRSEALISFSNAAFYDGRLITIPDRVLAAPAAAPEALTTSAPGAPAAAVDQLLAHPVSFHAVADGVYEARANAPEARLIAGMVRDLLARETGLSIGIVAFSEAQQGEIEDALDALAAEDKAFATRLDQEYAREDDGQINGLFVKNLENVQGDERDVILLSVCYAPDSHGRMAMNFGPINQRGGEKRLNVIFSRARRHMAVVSTIGPEAITNTHNDGARALRAFLAFAKAQARGDASHGQAVLAALNPEAQRVFATAPPADALRDAIAEALSARGHEVRTGVGAASFRCDLAILEPEGQRFDLGVLIDGDRPGAAEDRYVFQPQILKSFGWRVIDVPSHSWLKDPEAVIAGIEAALRSSGAALDDDPFEGAVPFAPRPRPEAPAAAPPPPAATSPQSFTELRFTQGASDKFWKIAVDGAETTVVFGRAGTRGSTVVKAFATPEKAQREAAKLIAEKLAKGYVET